MLTRTFHQRPGPGLGCQGPVPGQGLHSQGPGFEYEKPGQGQGLEKMWSHQCEHSTHLN